MNQDTPARSFFNAEDAADILPAWFLSHMMDESGLFGMMLSNGVLLAVERIERLHQAADGALWLDVILHPRPSHAADRQAPLMYAVAVADRPASINCCHIVAAFELGDGGESPGWGGAAMRVDGRLSR